MRVLGWLPRLQVLDALVDRLKDPEEKVRASAVAAICEAATADLQACWSSTWPCLFFKSIYLSHDDLGGKAHGVRRMSTVLPSFLLS